MLTKFSSNLELKLEFRFNNCSALLGPRHNTRVPLNHPQPTTHQHPPQTFWKVLGYVGVFD